MQLEYIKVMRALDHDSIKKSQKVPALREINMIKEKICEKLKGRTCADDRPQRCYIPKEYISSPDISYEDLLTIIIIDTHEVREVGFLMSLEHTLMLTY